MNKSKREHIGGEIAEIRTTSARKVNVPIVLGFVLKDYFLEQFYVYTNME